MSLIARRLGIGRKKRGRTLPVAGRARIAAQARAAAAVRLAAAGTAGVVAAADAALSLAGRTDLAGRLVAAVAARAGLRAVRPTVGSADLATWAEAFLAVTSGADDRVFGADPIGTARYAVPATNVRFVATNGSNGAAGTLAAPWQTLAYATANAPDGTTVVMRGGAYREGASPVAGGGYSGGAIVSGTKVLTIQNFPGEEVWLDGSNEVTGWVVHSTGVWRKDGWTTTFPYGTYADTVTPNRFIDPAHPYSIYPDQVFIDGAPLVQVGSVAEVGPGEFYVDQANDKLYIGTSPSGATVEASTKSWALWFNGGSGCKLRGIGVRRYGTDYTIHGAVRSYKAGTVVEHCHFEYCSDAAVTFQSGGDQVCRACTFGYMGHQSIHSYNPPRLLVEWCDVHHSNNEHFADWAAAGMKFTGISGNNAHISGLYVRNNRVTDSWCQPIWLDVWIADFEIVHNVMLGNDLDMSVEVCGHGIVACNILTGSGRHGLYNSESNHVAYWHNTVIGADQFLMRVFDGSRTNSDPYTPGVVSNVDIFNNVFVATSGTDRMVSVHHYLGARTYAQMVSGEDGNAFYRLAGPVPATFAQAPVQQAGQNLTYASLSAWKSATGREATSWEQVGGANPFVTGGGDYRVPPSSLAFNGGVPLPANVAAAIGVPAGSRRSPGVIYVG